MVVMMELDGEEMGRLVLLGILGSVLAQNAPTGTDLLWKTH